MSGVTHDGTRWSNADQDRVEDLVAYDPGWPAQYEAEARTPEDARITLVFCDHLRRHPEEATRYAALKGEVAARYPTDRDTYTEGKARYVDDIVREAGQP